MPAPSNLALAPLPTSLLAPEAALTISVRTCLLEGPAFDADGNLFFSDIIGNQVYRMTAEGVLSIFRSDSGRTNGNTFDAQGRLISCEGAEFGSGGRRRVVRTDLKSGQIDVLTDRFEGRRFNSPNDVVVDTQGRIWFTDPFYGDDRGALELDSEAVYRIDGDGSVTRVVSQPQIERPNGLAITPDGKTLYLIDSHTRPGGNRKVWSFDVADDGTVTGQRLVFDFGRGRGGDGMRLDEHGHLWVAAGINHPRHAGETGEVPAGVYVIAPDGRLLGRIPIPEDVCTNLTFGGPGRRTLYVTSGKSIFKIPWPFRVTVSTAASNFRIKVNGLLSLRETDEAPGPYELDALASEFRPCTRWRDGLVCPAIRRHRRRLSICQNWLAHGCADRMGRIACTTTQCAGVEVSRRRGGRVEKAISSSPLSIRRARFDLKIEYKKS